MCNRWMERVDVEEKKEGGEIKKKKTKEGKNEKERKRSAIKRK